MNLKHLNFKIDKPRYRNVAEKWRDSGRYYQWKQFEQVDKWWQTYPDQGVDADINEVAAALNISQFDYRPRFYWLKPNHDIPIHYDEDNVTSIQINLKDQTPNVGIENLGEVPYEALAINNGCIRHWVTPVPYERLQMKFVMRETWETVMEAIPDAILQN
jgi:hypothetical protein